MNELDKEVITNKQDKQMNKQTTGCGLATLLEGAGYFFTKFSSANQKLFYYGVSRL